MRSRTLIAVLLLAFLCSVGANAQSAPDDFTAQQEALLAEARTTLAEAPDDADAMIWVGRRLGYLGRFEEAIAVFKGGAARHPDDARFVRHLGHRLISMRNFEGAADALQKAADMMAARPNEIEPDGLPNDAGVPTSTLKGNIFYHLALAHYLKGDFASAATVWAQAAAVAANPDAASASRYWLYLARARAGDAEGAEAALAPVGADWTLLENHAYHRLALCFKGEGDCAALHAEALEAAGVAQATLLYGLGAKALIDGETARAQDVFARILASESASSFGYIAAEAERERALITP